MQTKSGYDKQTERIQHNGGLFFLRSPASYNRMNASAQEPYKEKPSEVSHLLTLIGRCDGRVEDRTNDINTFSTGIVLTPPMGFHFELVATSDLWKSGYMFLGPIILQPFSNDEITVPLYKFKDTEDLALPFRGVEVVLRESNYVHLTLPRPKNGNYEGTQSLGRVTGKSALSLGMDTDFDSPPVPTQRPSRSSSHHGGGLNNSRKSNMF